MAAVHTINAFERRGIAFLSPVDGFCLLLQVTSVKSFAFGIIDTFPGRGHMVVVMTDHLVPQVERYSRTTSRVVGEVVCAGGRTCLTPATHFAVLMEFSANGLPRCQSIIHTDERE